MSRVTCIYSSLLILLCATIASNIFDPVAAQAKEKDIIEGTTYLIHGGHAIRHHHRADPRQGEFPQVRSYHVPPELLSRKGGIEQPRKKRLILAGRVFIAPALRHLFFTAAGEGKGGNGTGLRRPNPSLDYDQLAVCQGSGGSSSSNSSSSVDDQPEFDKFACPLAVRSSSQQGRLRFIDDTEAAAYCCGPPGNQSCCYRWQFYWLYGQPAAVSAPVIAAVIGSGLALLLFLGGLLLCLRMRRRQQQQQQQKSWQRSKVNASSTIRDPAGMRAPLIPPPYTSKAPVWPTNQQTPISPSIQQPPLPLQ